MSLKVQAFAKINLTLEVLSKRDDGYHEVATILQTISIDDSITLEKCSVIELACNAPGMSEEDNLAYRAALLLKRAAGYTGGVRIALEKNIPVASGLGGGSSDAAAVLLGLNKLWGLGLATQDLETLAAQLGSDVPFFLYGGTALAKGRGELITPLPDPPEQQILVCVPDLEIPGKTAFMYGLLRPQDFTDASRTVSLAEHIASGGAIGSELLFNAFHVPALSLFPEVARCHEELVGLGLKDATLCGGGPSLYTMLPRGLDGERIAAELVRAGVKTYVAHTVPAYHSGMTPT